MNNDALKSLITQGLAAMKAGGKVAEAATAEIQNDARYPDLRAALDKGNETSKQWTQRIDQALQEAGGSGEQRNPILEAHHEVSRKIRQEATDDTSRDLGIVTAGQLALHYWIAAFGTMRAYAEQAGLSKVAQSMKASLDEAKQADEAHNGIARSLMAA